MYFFEQHMNWIVNLKTLVVFYLNLAAPVFCNDIAKSYGVYSLFKEDFLVNTIPSIYLYG